MIEQSFEKQGLLVLPKIYMAQAEAISKLKNILISSKVCGHLRKPELYDNKFNNWFKIFSPKGQVIRVAQRITRSATNREIAGSNPVTDNDIFFHMYTNS